ncbi:MAG: hypothetical protein O3A51_08575, partial [Verrucomicrobia bacterium]|nr:hypothetical protein [Verrucomicrobiota bacterium]
MTTPTRHFLGWDAPVTHKVADFLLKHRIPGPSPADDRFIDLGDTLIVVPTRQAGRHLSEALVRAAGANHQGLISLRIVTPTYFLQPDPAPTHEATGVDRRAAWLKTLCKHPDRQWPALFPDGVHLQDPDWLLQTSTMLEDLRITLAEGGYRPHDVITRCGGLLEEPERWAEIADLETSYLATLRTMDLSDPYINRIIHADSLMMPPEIRRVILAAVPDPSLLAVDALRTVSRQCAVDILIHASEEDAACFDEWGRPDVPFWSQAIVPIDESSIHLSGSPADQSRAVLDVLRANETDTVQGSIAIGVPDKNVISFVEATLGAAGLVAFDPSDRRLSDHRLYDLLVAYVGLLQDDSYTQFRHLIRHPDILLWLCQDDVDASSTSPRSQPGLNAWAILDECDRFQNRYLPATLSAIRERLSVSAERWPALARCVQRLSVFTAPPREAGETATALRRFLKTVYSAQTITSANPSDVEFEAAASQVDAILREIQLTIDRRDRPETEVILSLFLKRLAEETYHRPRMEAALDLEGWLELPWNDAPLLIITGLNEGSVPDSRVADVFLPDSLRRQLELRDDAQRLAREVYLLASMIAARRDTGRVHIVVGKTSAQGDPLKPSRLLFHCPDDLLSARARHLFGPINAHRPNLPATICFKLDSALPADVSVAGETAPELSVTAFRDYLSCPFR